MMRLFVYGTLLNRALLLRLVGPQASPRPAELRGWQRVILAGTPYPTLRRTRGARVEGLVIEVGAAALRRLSAYEGPAYRLRRVIVRSGPATVAAHAWIAAGGTPTPWPPPRSSDGVPPAGPGRWSWNTLQVRRSLYSES